MKHFSGRVAFVTGGASGIGYALVNTFLKLGMKVVVVGRNQKRLEDAKQALGAGDAVHLVQADVGEREQVRFAAEESLRAFGKIHVLCNNAALGTGGAAASPDFDAWDRALRIDLGGVVNGVKIITPLILSHGEGGHIVNTSSAAGFVPLPWPEAGEYATAKFAVLRLTESLRFSLAPYGIGVSCLCPGLTRTPIHDVRQELLAISMDPKDVAAAVVEGIRNNAPYILTHADFRDELREIYQKLDAAFPNNQCIPPERQAFENNRRNLAARLRTLPVKD
jgi:NAD(P)-dependent dehydrogenase (short-subunit alcohol dehydrogenase family)